MKFGLNIAYIPFSKKSTFASVKIEKKKKSVAPVRSAFNITCFAGSATFREILIHFKVNMYFTLIKKEISIKKKVCLIRICNCI